MTSAINLICIGVIIAGCLNKHVNAVEVQSVKSQ